MNDSIELSCDEQLLAEQVTTEPPIRRPPEQHQASTSHRKKKCRGNRKEQHARRRQLRKRDLKEATTVSRVGITTETQLTMMNTEMTDEPSDSMVAPMEEMTQV